ncbi:MAG: manganese efflux pump MntP family protein [Erysipelotrichaceae bacterium]|nr:manganese efflux pump MntP family protein [Erysipelotrichaceae bacterium]
MFEVILLGISLAMDSLSMSIVNGIKYKNYSKKMMLVSSASFGLFQGTMPLLGYLIFLPFIKYVDEIDHWIVFMILGYLGISMIIEGIRNNDEQEATSESFSYKILFTESVATSIDALSVGVTLPSLAVNSYLSCLIIAGCTFLICLIGHSLGKKIALLLKNKAIIFGGSVLFLIGLKTLLEGLGIL